MQMCHWPRMEHNEQNQWPLLVFSSLPALLSFEKCVICSCRCTNLCWITASPPADIASTLPAQTPPSEEASVYNGPVNCVLLFFFLFLVFIPEELNPIDVKSNFGPEILNLMHAKLNLDMGSVSSLTHLADLYIFI